MSYLLHPFRCSNLPEFYSSWREQFLVSTNWTKDRWKTIHAIASSTKSIFALSTALSLLYFYCIYSSIYLFALVFVVSIVKLPVEYRILLFLWGWDRSIANERNPCLCTECTALWWTLCSRFLDEASTAQTVQRRDKTVCSTEFDGK